MSTISVNPYAVFKDLRNAGWKRDFDKSGGNFLCVPISGAPPLGGNAAGGLLYAGAWSKPDGTMIFQRSNMDRSITTIVLDPMGVITHTFHDPTLWESCGEIRNLIDQKVI